MRLELISTPNPKQASHTKIAKLVRIRGVHMPALNRNIVNAAIVTSLRTSKLKRITIRWLAALILYNGIKTKTVKTLKTLKTRVNKAITKTLTFLPFNQ